MDLLRTPWPWYVVGPVIGLVVVALLVIGNHPFGVSGNLRHLCAIIAPRRTAFCCRSDWCAGEPGSPGRAAGRCDGRRQ